MRILVLGGSGFLGSHVADQLILAGHDVRVFDRESSPWLHPDQEMIVGDLSDQYAMDEAIKGCDVVYNFAAIADLDEALSKPVETARINVLGNVQVLEACLKARIQRYIYASTVYVYSRDGGFYRCSKQAAEQPEPQRCCCELSRAPAHFAILWETLPQYFELPGTARPAPLSTA